MRDEEEVGGASDCVDWVRFRAGEQTVTDPEAPAILAGPYRELAVSVVNRTVRDALLSKHFESIKRPALRAINEPINSEEFTFYWWLCAAFPNAERALSLIQAAVANGRAYEIVYSNGRFNFRMRHHREKNDCNG